ncbi:MAG TPA: ABC transporter permease [Anaerolineales bacterium]|nr:ABC transporter permease [Anaerolineales bacterium]
MDYLKGHWAGTRKRKTRSRLPASLVFGTIGVLVLGLLFLVGPLILSYAPNDQDVDHRLQAPGPVHWLGTDNYGRDLFSRLLHAGRIDFQIALIATFLAFTVGMSLGALAGFYEGLLDTLIMRVLDILVAFPDLVLVIVIVGLLGQGLLGLYIALALVGWVPYARLVRGEVLAVKQRDYVLAARALGSNNVHLLWRHLLPHSISQAVVYAASSVTFNILAISSLGYLGVGILPPQAEWGAMIAEGRSFILSSPGLVLFPVLMLTLTGVILSVLGDGLAELLQPVGDMHSAW